MVLLELLKLTLASEVGGYKMTLEGGEQQQDVYRRWILHGMIVCAGMLLIASAWASHRRFSGDQQQ